MYDNFGIIQIYRKKLLQIFLQGYGLTYI